MLTNVLRRVMHGDSLAEKEMAEVFGAMMDGEVSPEQMAGFLVALRLKGETIDEITGAARAMRARMSRIQVRRTPLIDTCGTGGDGAGTFNISTTVAFVVAAAGGAVAKHGNRAVSSRCGSADVLAALGVNIAASPETVQRCIEEIGIGFLFAPSCHPAMKHAMPVRKKLGVRTVFNVLGPLTNPAGAPRQLLGVFDRQLGPMLAEVLGRLGCERAWVVHGADGLDELTVCDDTFVFEWDGHAVRELRVSPEQVGLSRSAPEGLKGGTPEENAAILREILRGERQGPLRDAVVLNAGAALAVAGLADDLAAGSRRAAEILDAGSAATVVDQLVTLSSNS